MARRNKLIIEEKCLARLFDSRRGVTRAVGKGIDPASAASLAAAAFASHYRALKTIDKSLCAA